MTALPVAFYLKELSGDASRKRSMAALGTEDGSDLEFQLREAHARGVAEGRAAAQAAHEAAAGSQAASFEQKLKSEREAWAATQSDHLATLIGTAFDTLERRISEVVSNALKPVLHEQVRARAVEDIAQSLNAMLSKGDYAKISISGPRDLVDRMKTALAPRHDGLTFAETTAVDLTVSADDTILETRIGAWAEAIAGSQP